MFDTLTKAQQIKAFGIKSLPDDSDANKLSFLLDFLVYFEYVLPDEDGNYTFRRDEVYANTEGIHPIDDMIPDVIKAQGPNDIIDKFIDRVPARSHPNFFVPQINININIAPSTTDEELDSLVKKAKFVIDSLR
jgi:hypothetical protein